MERMGLIPRYRGVLIHDCLGAYFTFLMCWHGLCNAHLQRELTYLFEELDQTWAAVMIELLLKAKDLAEREMAREEGSRRIIGEGRLKKRWRATMRSSPWDIRKTLNPRPNRKASAEKSRAAKP